MPTIPSTQSAVTGSLDRLESLASLNPVLRRVIPLSQSRVHGINRDPRRTGMIIQQTRWTWLALLVTTLGCNGGSGVDVAARVNSDSATTTATEPRSGSDVAAPVTKGVIGFSALTLTNPFFKIIADNKLTPDDTRVICADNYENAKLTIGKDCVIRSFTVIYSGTVIGDGLQTGHHTIIRENNVLGKKCVVGVYCNILDGCKIGDYVHFHSYDSISENSIIGDFAYFYPFVTVTDDPTPPSNLWDGCEFGEFTVIASNAFILPGTKIGRHCFVGAQSRVGGKFEDFSFIAGQPAKRVMDVRKVPIINKETKRRQYPWPYNFDRNMPWAEIGFDEWLRKNNREL